MSKKSPHTNRFPHDRRKFVRRAEDRGRDRSLIDSKRRLKSLVELGRIIGLDLEIDGMLLKIAEKAAELYQGFQLAFTIAQGPVSAPVFGTADEFPPVVRKTVWMRALF